MMLRGRISGIVPANDGRAARAASAPRKTE